MNSQFSFSVGVVTAAIAVIPSLAQAHGYATYPKARQVICSEQGGHWGSQDGSTIANEACRAAFQESGTYPFVQINEFATLVPDYNNMNAVKEAVKDGLICSGGDVKKSGMSAPSLQWQRTPMKAGETFTLKYLATAPHNPSHWQIYLTNANYNAAHSRVAWRDLDLIQEFGNIAKVNIDGTNYYQMEVSLPTDRVGDATLVTRWQRDDPAGEGFYNCSDIKFDGDAPAPTWSSKGTYVKPGVVANDGDSVWFRIFSEQGNELVFEKLPITAANADLNVWSYELAQQINAKYPTIAQIGVKNANDEIVYESSDLHLNQVYVTNGNYNYALDVREGGILPPPSITIEGLSTEYQLDANNSADISAVVRSEGDYSVSMQLLNQSNQEIGKADGQLSGQAPSLSLTIPVTAEGTFQLKITATDAKGVVQTVEERTVTVKPASSGGDYDYEYPSSIGSYGAGTKVLAKDGNIYECKPFPASGWCRIYSSSANHYEPGVGSHWSDAWLKQ
ncbi:lytic polysaccharide monooxygenase [Photobacterium swingsii]|uniref:lytic polysaccharide monooxygenase n=1 Tax=Photobacterium swingsii TaxID=680026 RepID=UPI003552CB8B